MNPDEIRRALELSNNPAILIPIGLIPLLHVIEVRKEDWRGRVKTVRCLAWKPEDLHEFFEEMMDDGAD